MFKRKIYPIVAGVVLVLAAVSNPSRERHATWLENVHSVAIPGEGSVVFAVAATKTEYHNYLIFSTTTDREGRVASYGLFGNVHDDLTCFVRNGPACR